MILSNEKITKALIRLCGCTCWSAPLLFAYPEDRLSRVEVHIYSRVLYFFFFYVSVSYFIKNNNQLGAICTVLSDKSDSDFIFLFTIVK